MSKIFISYRRDDSAGYAHAIHSRLLQHFSKDQVFMDVDTMKPGVDFVRAIEKAVGECDVLVALIGKRWTGGESGGTSRFDNARDYVRLEVSTALARDILVIPVLIDGMTMPGEDNLPTPVQPITRRNAIEISNTRFNYDVDQLINAVRDILEATEAKRKADEEAERNRIEEEAEKCRLEAEAQRKADDERPREQQRQKTDEEVKRKADEEERRIEEERNRAEQEAERRRLEAEKQEDGLLTPSRVEPPSRNNPVVDATVVDTKSSRTATQSSKEALSPRADLVLRRLFEGIFLPTLVITGGWGILVSLSWFLREVSVWTSSLLEMILFMGILGGFLNALILRWIKVSMAPRNFLYLVTGWAIPFLFVWLILLFLQSNGAPPWALGAACATPWAISGLVTGIILREEKSSIEWKHIILMAASWLIGWVSYIPIDFYMEFGSAPSSFILSPLSIIWFFMHGAFIGAIGGGYMLSQFGRQPSYVPGRE